MNLSILYFFIIILFIYIFYISYNYTNVMYTKYIQYTYLLYHSLSSKRPSMHVTVINQSGIDRSILKTCLPCLTINVLNRLQVCQPIIISYYTTQHKWREKIRSITELYYWQLYGRHDIFSDNNRIIPFSWVNKIPKRVVLA